MSEQKTVQQRAAELTPEQRNQVTRLYHIEIILSIVIVAICVFAFGFQFVRIAQADAAVKQAEQSLAHIENGVLVMGDPNAVSGVDAIEHKYALIRQLPFVAGILLVIYAVIALAFFIPTKKKYPYYSARVYRAMVKTHYNTQGSAK